MKELHDNPAHWHISYAGSVQHGQLQIEVDAEPEASMITTDLFQPIIYPNSCVKITVYIQYKTF